MIVGWEVKGGHWLNPSTIALILATQKPPWYLKFIPGGVKRWREEQKQLIEYYEKLFMEGEF